MPALKSTVAAALIVLALGAPSAQTITVAMAQNASAPESAVIMSKNVEDEILGIMFDRGYIVSTAELALADDGFAAPNFAVKEAAFGMSDYLIAVNVKYGVDEIKDSEKNVSYAQILSLDWKLVRVSNPVILASGTVRPERTTVVDQDPYGDARRLIDGAYPSIEKALGEAKKGGIR